ncbi:MAG: hypothetical protein Q8J61_06075, partial [Sulfuricella sp.]|nr:hypothetical protein [Sulfuricella sp.]
AVVALGGKGVEFVFSHKIFHRRGAEAQRKAIPRQCGRRVLFAEPLRLRASAVKFLLISVYPV